MKARWLPVLLGLMTVAIPARAQLAPPSFIGPDGQKKIGQYVWVWHTAHISKSGQMQVEADCPVGYVVLGGGYNNKAGIVQAPHPNGAFDGWVVNFVGSGYEAGKITVYASCAPSQ